VLPFRCKTFREAEQELSDEEHPLRARITGAFIRSTVCVRPMPPSDSGLQPNEKEAPEQSSRVVSGVSSCGRFQRLLKLAFSQQSCHQGTFALRADARVARSRQRSIGIERHSRMRSTSLSVISSFVRSYSFVVRGDSCPAICWACSSHPSFSR